MSLTEEFKFKSTPDGSPPTGRARAGTFRDVSFVGMSPDNIDLIDSECAERGITRFGWIMEARSSHEGASLLHKRLKGIHHRGWAKAWNELDESIKADCPSR
jgi:hypothetical protein